MKNKTFKDPSGYSDIKMCVLPNGDVLLIDSNDNHQVLIDANLWPQIVGGVSKQNSDQARKVAQTEQDLHKEVQKGFVG